MKKLSSVLAAVIMLISACDNKSSATQEEILPNKIYFFYSNSCPHCHEALEYINKKYPDLKLSMVNVANPDGYNLFIKCAQKFKLGNRIGTPLFCMGDKNIMGWAPEYAEEFDQYVKPFLR